MPPWVGWMIIFTAFIPRMGIRSLPVRNTVNEISFTLNYRILTQEIVWATVIRVISCSYHACYRFQPLIFTFSNIFHYTNQLRSKNVHRVFVNYPVHYYMHRFTLQNDLHVSLSKVNAGCTCRRNREQC